MEKPGESSVSGRLGSENSRGPVPVWMTFLRCSPGIDDARKSLLTESEKGADSLLTASACEREVREEQTLVFLLVMRTLPCLPSICRRPRKSVPRVSKFRPPGPAKRNGSGVGMRDGQDGSCRGHGWATTVRGSEGKRSEWGGDETWSVVTSPTTFSHPKSTGSRPCF